MPGGVKNAGIEKVTLSENAEPGFYRFSEFPKYITYRDSPAFDKPNPHHHPDFPHGAAR